ncbi:MAG: prepilin-type N-terminal cleavage/methylation domain-containing protein [Desulfobacterales bacterium]|nr:prepilin-type N-terminal cleavage/methylation domain-containing protein [Desulfobacterales bacterium]
MNFTIMTKRGGPPPGGGPRGPAGFTLIEILTAMMILTISMVMIMQLFSGGLRAGKLSEDYNRAILHARAKMEETLIEENLTEGVLEGEFEDGFRWKTEIAAHLDPEEELEENPPPVPVSLVDVKVEVGWRSGVKERTFRIHTLKLVESDGDDD